MNSSSSVSGNFGANGNPGGMCTTMPAVARQPDPGLVLHPLRAAVGLARIFHQLFSRAGVMGRLGQRHATREGDRA
ncbi:hypothetical protein, partial [Methylocaldum szegediense]|uniref:hypothetical protein n=1 Tax=Methylocaldum szegediense TaxID=73780 RepID=UPI001F2CC99C